MIFEEQRHRRVSFFLFRVSEASVRTCGYPCEEYICGMPLGQVILIAEYCPGDCSQTVTGHPAVSQVALSRTSVMFG